MPRIHLVVIEDVEDHSTSLLDAVRHVSEHKHIEVIFDKKTDLVKKETEIEGVINRYRDKEPILLVIDIRLKGATSSRNLLETIKQQNDPYLQRCATIIYTGRKNEATEETPRSFYVSKTDTFEKIRERLIEVLEQCVDLLLEETQHA